MKRKNTHDYCLLCSLRSCKSLRNAMPVMTSFLKFSLKRPVALDPAFRVSGIVDAEDIMGEIWALRPSCCGLKLDADVAIADKDVLMALGRFCELGVWYPPSFVGGNILEFSTKSFGVPATRRWKVSMRGV